MALILGVVALGIAAVFAAWQPRRDVLARASRPRALLVRWGHSAVWVLIAAWALLLEAGIDTPLGAIAGVLYVVWIVSFLGLAR